MQATVQGHIAEASNDSWSPDDTLLFSSSSDAIWGMPANAILWNVQSDSVVVEFSGIPMDITGITSSWLDSTHLVFSDFEHTWRWQNGEIEFTLTGQSDNTLISAFPEISPDGNWGAVTDQKLGNMILIRDMRTAGLITQLKGHQARVTNMLWTPDGHTFISADETGTILFWDVTYYDAF